MDTVASPQFSTHVALQNPPPPEPHAPPSSLVSTTSSPRVHVTIIYTAIQSQTVHFDDGRLTATDQFIAAAQPHSFVLGTLGMLHIRPARIFRNLARVLTRFGIPDPRHHQQLGLSLTRQIDELTRDLPRTLPELRLVWTLERRDEFVRNLAVDVAEQGDNDNNDDSIDGMVPAAPGALTILTAVETGSAAGEDCSICLDDLVTGGGGETTKATAMPCKHKFHEQCIVSWLKLSHYCPICRFEMPTAMEARQLK